MPRMRSGAIFRAFRCGEAPQMRGGGAAFRTVSGRFSGCGCMPCVGRLSCEVSGPVGGGGVRFGAWKCNMRQKEKEESVLLFFCCCPLLLGVTPAFWLPPAFGLSPAFSPPRGRRLSAFGDAARRRGADGRCGVAGLQLLDVAGRAVARAARRGAVRLA